MSRRQSRHSDTVDELLALLADDDCRSVLRYFRDGAADEVTVQQLAREITTQPRESEQNAITNLHHSVAPRLAEADVVDYDADLNLIRYRGHDDLERLYDVLDDIDTNPDRQFGSDSQ